MDNDISEEEPLEEKPLEEEQGRSSHFEEEEEDFGRVYYTEIEKTYEANTQVNLRSQWSSRTAMVDACFAPLPERYGCLHSTGILVCTAPPLVLPQSQTHLGDIRESEELV